MSVAASASPDGRRYEVEDAHFLRMPRVQADKRHAHGARCGVHEDSREVARDPRQNEPLPGPAQEGAAPKTVWARAVARKKAP